jgi:hypothetical protein
MSGPGLRTRLALFLYGTRNMVGSLCALAVLGLYYAGLIESWWLALTLGAYVAGWLATPPNPEFDFRYVNEVSQTNLLDMLDQLIQSSSARLPADAKQKLLEIREHAAACLAGQEDGAENLDAMHGIELTHALGRDLPETIRNYLALPPSFAQLYQVRDGKTPRQLLLEQLDLLSKEVGDISKDLYASTADKLAVHGQYLKQKFQSVQFLPE